VTACVQIEVWFNFSRFVGHNHRREICLLRYARKNNSLGLFSVLGQWTLTLCKSFAPNFGTRARRFESSNSNQLSPIL
jgi:hypothetical protein